VTSSPSRAGERQRMVLARALAHRPMVMVLDEPITGLDLRHQITILELLQKEVHECGLTVLATAAHSRWRASSPIGSSCSITDGWCWMDLGRGRAQ